MGRGAIEHLLYLLDLAFESDGEHSLLANLASLRAEDWLWLPPGGGRSARDICLHCAAAKQVYANQAFGDASLFWTEGVRAVTAASPDSGALLEGLHAGQEALRAGLRALTDDAELLLPRPVHYGGRREVRQIIATMVLHDTYHAGEINHLRALRQGTDRWP